jgi:hypothetical protein
MICFWVKSFLISWVIDIVSSTAAISKCRSIERILVLDILVSHWPWQSLVILCKYDAVWAFRPPVKVTPNLLLRKGWKIYIASDGSMQIKLVQNEVLGIHDDFYGLRYQKL